jgi:hypothetical protein
MLMQSMTPKKNWHGAGTFGFLVTLMEHVNAAEGSRGLSWRTDYD